MRELDDKGDILSDDKQHRSEDGIDDNQNDRRIKKDEIPLPYAFAHPGAVVIVAFNATLTLRTMDTLRGTKDATLLTPCVRGRLISWQCLKVFRPFRYYAGIHQHGR
eukprot:GILK01006419.1.p3 GENE.GILK01006419.1~~GILK01006419.1.p3  ORF type:complete len:107 (-),score=6.41 GILK01006419.1:400-720(-)